MAYATEPNSLNLVLEHIEQITPVINRHRDCVYIMQGVFIGNWGEMHHSKFQDEESIKQLINKLNDVIDTSIYLSLRTPKQWRTVNCSNHPKNNTRIGLFNDGILGSESDLGTYAENEKEKELKFQSELCRYVPNGGEVVFNNNLCVLENSVSSLKEMQISYLNADYDSRVLEKWKSYVWSGNDIFNDCDGYTYIKSHLGYRYEDNVLWRINNEQFRMLSDGYTDEQKSISLRLPDLEKEIQQLTESVSNVDKFITIAKKYTRITELTPEILHTFISKIVIHERSERYKQKTEQQIDIYFTHIGIVGEA